MSDLVIDIRNVSKCYTLAHQDRPDSVKAWLSDLVAGRRPHHPVAHKKWNEDYWALRNVSLQVNSGDCLALIGCNGSGKSTLLKILSRIISPTIGEIAVRGRVASLLEVGTGFHPDLTGRENIFLNGTILGCSERQIRRRFDNIVEFSGVEKFLDVPVKHYSSGMYMRLGYAVAAHADADILIVDEVLAVGDSDFQERCIQHITDFTNSGRTVLFVSHNAELVKKLASRIAHLESGILIEDKAVCGDSRKLDLGPPVQGEAIPLLQTEELCLRDSWVGDDGDGTFRMSATFVRAQQGLPARTHLPITIGLRGRLLEPIDDLVAAIEIRSPSGLVLAYSAYDDQLPPPAETVFVGVFAWNVTIPPNTLAEGIYEIAFDIGMHNKRRIVSDACNLRIRVVNDAGYGLRHPSDVWRNLIRPAWLWEEQ